MDTCKICGNKEGNKKYIIQELMLELHENFNYFQCANCSCIQIAQVPENLSNYYPKNYYSFSAVNQKFNFRNFLKKHQIKFLTKKKTLFGRTVNSYFKSSSINWLQKLNISYDSKILDVGCGNGQLLFDLWNSGYKNIKGLDPFIKEDIIYKKKFNIDKKSLNEEFNFYDFIILSHSFEHMDNPLDVLTKLKSVLTKNGIIVIRIPIANAYVWKKYGVKWVQLDAPRHLFIHHTKSMEVLCSKLNLIIKDVFFDSGAFQFWGSEQYLKGIGLFNENSYAINPKKSFFTKKQIKEYSIEAERLNQIQEGDMASIFISCK